MKEECGIVGIIFNESKYTNTKTLGLKLYYSLYALQHRGQDSMGIYINNNETDNFIVKKLGLVSECHINEISNIFGKVGIGHVRCAIKETVNIQNCQPFYFTFKKGKIGISYNGNLVNSFLLRKKLKENGKIFTTDSDCEIIAYLLIDELLQTEPVEAIKKVISKLIGAYSLVIIINELLYAIRDPYAIKPLCYGNIGSDFYIIASESTALDAVNGKLIRDVKPGEIIEFNKNGSYTSYETIKDSISAHCIFEYIYLARPDSIIDGKLVYEVRNKIGQKLASEESMITGDIICPIPDSGVIAAIGYSMQSKIMYVESIVKNRYIGRTFILPTQKERESAVKLKLNTINSSLKNKNIILIDDSIVRGTTSKRIIKMIKKTGAKSIHVRIGSPPIISPCYLGTDMANRNELIASSRCNNDICSIIKADTLKYISIDGLIECIGIEKEKLCLGCITEKYPVKINNEKITNHTIRNKYNS